MSSHVRTARHALAACLATTLALPAAGAVTDNLYYDLATDPLSDWTLMDGGGSHSGLRLQSAGTTIHYIKSDLDIDNQKA